MSNHRFFSYVLLEPWDWVAAMEPRATRNCIVEESPDDLLEKADGIWWKSGRVVNIVRILEFGAIDRLRPGIGGILLAFGLGMLKLVQ